MRRGRLADGPRHGRRIAYSRGLCYATGFECLANRSQVHLYDIELTVTRLAGVVARDFSSITVQTGLRAARCTSVDLARAHAIMKCAEDNAVDMIAIGTHGCGPIGRFMLGSIADKVVRSAGRPVLLVRVPAGAS